MPRRRFVASSGEQMSPPDREPKKYDRKGRHDQKNDERRRDGKIFESRQWEAGLDEASKPLEFILKTDGLITGDPASQSAIDE